jgi:hypothetical protein
MPSEVHSGEQSKGLNQAQVFPSLLRLFTTFRRRAQEDLRDTSWVYTNSPELCPVGPSSHCISACNTSCSISILKDSNSPRDLCHHCHLVHPPTICGLRSTTFHCHKSRLKSSFFRDLLRASCNQTSSKWLLLAKGPRNTSFCTLWPNRKIGSYYHDAAVQRLPSESQWLSKLR